MANKDINCKIKVQQIIDNNTTMAVGDFHSDDFDSDAFICDINKNFNLISSVYGANVHELLEKTIKSSTTNVRGRFNSRELNKTKLIKQLFANFKIEMSC